MKILNLKYKTEKRIIVKSSLGWLGLLVGDFQYYCLKLCENCDLKIVVKTHDYSIHKAKNVFDTMF